MIIPADNSQKNDMIDAEAICEAALRPEMRFVSPNTVEQQDLQNIHRAKTALYRRKA